MAAALQQQLQISGKNNQVGELDLQEQIPTGMRVLVADDDPTCLRVLEGLLRKCSYRVTCGKATVALSMLLENRDNFDLVISDVYMPDMDGFKLLVGLEMNLPVIKAVPKRILELMNVQGLTRENVASHLQKYRLYLGRLSGVGHQQQNMGSSFPGTSESSFGHVNSLEGLDDLRALARSGQLS